MLVLSCVYFGRLDKNLMILEIQTLVWAQVSGLQPFYQTFLNV